MGLGRYGDIQENKTFSQVYWQPRTISKKVENVKTIHWLTQIQYEFAYHGRDEICLNTQTTIRQEQNTFLNKLKNL